MNQFQELFNMYNWANKTALLILKIHFKISHRSGFGVIFLIDLNLDFGIKFVVIRIFLRFKILRIPAPYIPFHIKPSLSFMAKQPTYEEAVKTVIQNELDQRFLHAD